MKSSEIQAIAARIAQTHNATQESDVEWSTRTKLNQQGVKVSIQVFLESSDGIKKEINVDLPDLNTMVVETDSNKFVPLSNYYADYFQRQLPKHSKRTNKLEFRPNLEPEPGGFLTVSIPGELLIVGDGAYDCSYCEGKGYTTSWTDEYSHAFGHYTKDTADKCDECAGKGEIQIEDTFSMWLQPELQFDETTGDLVEAERIWVGELHSRGNQI